MSYIVPPPLHIVERGIGGEDDRSRIAPHPPMTRPRERRAMVATLKVVLVHRDKLTDVGSCDIGARRESRIERLAREAHIPRADVLTDVAAEQPVIDLRRLRGGEFAAVFDREIGNASARVEIARSGKRLSWTGVEAAPARPTAIGFEGQIRL